jgi:hypothetical protein
MAETGRNFASCIGTGGIIDTIFVWPKIDKLPGDLEYRGELEVMKALLLTPDEDAPSGESGLISTGGR